MSNGSPPSTASTRQRGRGASHWTAAPHPRSCPLPCCSYRALRFHLSRVAFVQTGHPATLPDDGRFLLLAAFEVAASSRDLAEEALLGQVATNAVGKRHREISEHQPRPTVDSG